MYDIIIFDGKPFTVKVKTEAELKAILTRVYIKNKDNDYFEIEIFKNGVDITECQFMNEMIGTIMDEVEKGE